jgi:hypothetical protein
MVQWTEKPAARPQVSAPGDRQPEPAYRPVRKAKKSLLPGAMQVLTVCAVFGLVVGSYFLITPATSTGSAPRQTAQAPDTTGRVVIKEREHCRELGFDNQSGKMAQKGTVSCQDAPSYDGSPSQSLYRHPTNRLESIRKSFSQ